MPRKPVDVSDYDRQREGQSEHVSEYTRMQEVRGTESAPSLLALRRPRTAEASPRNEQWEMKGYDRRTGERFTRDFDSQLDAWEEHDRLEDAGFDVGEPYRVEPSGEITTPRAVEADAWERRHYIDTHYPDGTPRPEGDPARPWDRVLWGIAEIAAERGVVNDAREGYREAGNIWHYPTASFDDSYSREQVIDGMEKSLAPQFGINANRSEEERLERTREDLDFSRNNYWRVAHAERDIPTKDELDRTVEMELDAAIKNDYPAIRRNTKQYKELYASHQAGAFKFYVQRGEEAKARAVTGLEREQSEMAEPGRKARSDAKYQLRRVAWIEALKPGSERAARERSVAERQLAMADEYDKHLNEEIARVKSLAVGRPGNQPAV